jgi:hypothetical protein
VDASNPSDFEFLPLGALEFRILTSSGGTFAVTSTQGPVSLPQGNLSYSLRGELWVKTPADLAEFEMLLAEYAAGRASPIVSVFHTVLNQPVYQAALQGLSLQMELPGVEGGVSMFDQVTSAHATHSAPLARPHPLPFLALSLALSLRLHDKGLLLKPSPFTNPPPPREGGWKGRA